MSRIAIVGSPGTFLASLGAMIDAHARMGEPFAANPPLGDYAEMATKLVLVAAQGETLTLAGGRAMKTDLALHALAGERLIYLPSFQIAEPDRIERQLRDAGALHRWLAGQVAAGALIGACGASVCHLAAAGLLDGATAAVHPRLVTAFARLFPAVRMDRIGPVVEAGPLFTCGPDAADAVLVGRLLGAAFGPSISRGLMLREPVTPPAASAGRAVDPLLGEAKLWIQERFARAVRIGDLARLLGVSQQTLLRRFRAAGEGSPRAFVQKVRMDAAAAMLRETHRPVGEIAQLVGFTDLRSFRTIFTRLHGLSPSRYRRAMREARRGDGGAAPSIR